MRDRDQLPEPSVWRTPSAWPFWLRHLSNPCPGPEWQPVQDGRGRTYWLRLWQDEQAAILNLKYRGRHVAYVNLTGQEEDQVELCDISVDSTHRRQGLGRLLVRQAIICVRARGATSLCGRIVAKDLAAFPGLVLWYEDLGFVVEAVETPSELGGTNTVAVLRLPLRNAQPKSS